MRHRRSRRHSFKRRSKLSKRSSKRVFRSGLRSHRNNRRTSLSHKLQQPHRKIRSYEMRI
jgi:hypothetical protein